MANKARSVRALLFSLIVVQGPTKAYKVLGRACCASLPLSRTDRVGVTLVQLG